MISKYKILIICICFLLANIFGSFANDTGFFGYWENVDKNTRGITKYYFKNDGKGGSLRFRAFGSCSPVDCDWGSVTAYTYGADVNDRNHQYATALCDSGGSVIAVTLEFMDDGRVLMDSFTRFTDNSNRQNYHSYDIFVRINAGQNEPPPSCPDLVIDRIYPYEIDKKTKKLTVQVDIKNIGTMRTDKCSAMLTDLTNQETISANYSDTSSVKPLNPGESQTITFKITYRTEFDTNLTVEVVVDSQNMIEECNEKNNTKTSSSSK